MTIQGPKIKKHLMSEDQCPEKKVMKRHLKTNSSNGKKESTEFNIGLGKNFDLCNVIKICAKSKVEEIQFGDVRITFQGQKSVDQQAPKPLVSATIPNEQEALKISEAAERQLSLEQLRQDVDELKLSDPHAYERFIEGELGDAGGGSAEAT